MFHIYSLVISEVFLLNSTYIRGKGRNISIHLMIFNTAFKNMVYIYVGNDNNPVFITFFTLFYSEKEDFYAEIWIVFAYFIVTVH